MPKSDVELTDRAAIYYIGRRETTAERVRRLQAEARLMAREHIEALENALAQTAAIAREVADGGEAYPVGVREMASRLADDLPDRLVSLRSLADRFPGPKL